MTRVRLILPVVVYLLAARSGQGAGWALLDVAAAIASLNLAIDLCHLILAHCRRVIAAERIRCPNP